MEAAADRTEIERRGESRPTATKTRLHGRRRDMKTHRAGRVLAATHRTGTLFAYNRALLVIIPSGACERFCVTGAGSLAQADGAASGG